MDFCWTRSGSGQIEGAFVQGRGFVPVEEIVWYGHGSSECGADQKRCGRNKPGIIRAALS
jgi:hypothetical protein